MAAMARCDVLTKHISEIVSVGFGDLAKGDPGMARSVCMALSAIARNNDGTRINLSETVEKEIWDKVHFILRGGFIQSEHWFATAQEAINLVFALHPRPDIFMLEVVRTVAFGMFGNMLKDMNNSNDNNNTNNNNNNNNNNNELESNNLLHEEKDEEKVELLEEDEEISRNRENGQVLYKKFKLAKFFFILGSTVIKLLVYIDEKESELIKKRNERRHANASKKNANRKRSRRSSRMNDNNNNSMIDSGISDNEDDDGLDDVLGGDAREDYEIEKIKLRAEKSLVEQGFILGKFVPMIVTVIADPQTFSVCLCIFCFVYAF